MKKAIFVGFLALIIPFSSHAAVNPGIEFLSPLVQTIIGLLQDRISILSAENTSLRQQVASCGATPVVGTQNESTPTTPTAPPTPVTTSTVQTPIVR